MRKTVLAAITLAFALASCGDSGSNNTDSMGVEETQNAANQEQVDAEMVTEVLYPSPLQIISVFQRSGLQFNEQLILPSSAEAEGGSRINNTILLGAFSTDLAYCILNDQSNRSLEYLNAINTTADNVGIRGFFNAEEMFARAEKNISNRDSILEVATNVQEQLDTYIEDSHDYESAALLFLGAWLESYHIAFESFTKDNEQVVLHRMMEHLRMLNYVFEPFKNNTDNLELKDLLTSLENLKNSYSSLLDKEAIEVADLKPVSAEIEKIRSSIVASQN